MKSEKPTPHAMHVEVASSGNHAGAGRTVEPEDLADDEEEEEEEDEAAALPFEAKEASEACRTIKQSASRESETDFNKASGMRRRSRKRFGASLADRAATADDEADADDDAAASADSAPPLDFFFFFLPSAEDPDAAEEAEEADDTAPPGGKRCEKR